MTLARDIMRPAHAVIHVDHSLDEAIARFHAYNVDLLVVLDGDEVVGFLDRSIMEDTFEKEGTTIDEMVGNLMITTLRVSRKSDPLSRIEELFKSRHVRLVAVTDSKHQICGVILREDIVNNPHCYTPPTLKLDESDFGVSTGGRATPAEHTELKVYSEKPHIGRQLEEKAKSSNKNKDS